jgi:hypothetical protein
MSADETKLFRALQKVVDKNKEVDKSLKDVGKSGEDASKKAGDGVKKVGDESESATAKIGKMAMGFATVGTAVSAVTAVINEMNKAIEESKQLTEKLKTSRANLASVATDAADYHSLEDRASRAAIARGIDPEMARNLMFSARSSGYEADFENVARYAAFFDSSAVSTAADKLPQIFGGRVNASQALNATFAAAQQSNLNFAEIAASAPQAAEGGAFLGASPAETLGTLSVLAAQFKSGNTAADRMKAFGVQMQLQEGFQGLGYIEAVKKLQAMPAAERQGILGQGQELNVAYQKLVENLDLIEQRTAQVQSSIDATGTGGDMISQMEGIYFSSSTNRSLFERDRARVGRQLGEEGRLSSGALSAEAQAEAIRQQQGMYGAHQAEIAVGSITAYGAGFFDPRLAPVGQRVGTDLIRRAGGLPPLPVGWPAAGQGQAEDAAAAEAARRAILEVGQQSRGPSTLARPDVDR